MSESGQFRTITGPQLRIPLNYRMTAGNTLSVSRSVGDPDRWSISILSVYKYLLNHDLPEIRYVCPYCTYYILVLLLIEFLY